MKAKLIGIPLAALLLIGGATAVLAQTGAAQSAATTVGSVAHRAGDILEDVLADLVGDGTLTQEQADAVTDALETRLEELRAEHEAIREQMRTFLEDGALSAEELAQLPEDHPLRNLDEYLEDGQLTEDELSELRPLRGPGHHGRGGPGPFGGPGFAPDGAPDDGATPDATEEPASTT